MRSSIEEPRIIIIGAGPTGLGAAWRLHELGYSNWMLFESSDHAGGLASSVTDAQGFTWDMGVHVLHSHYQYFNHVMSKLDLEWTEHRREAWSWMRERWVPYPIQNNFWRLPPKEVVACLDGLQHRQPPTSEYPSSFRDWLLEQFGQGICESFMFPYNQKVWGYDPSQLDARWMGERVAMIDLQRVIANTNARRDVQDWGPNATFVFPTRGGTGTIWQSLSARLPSEHQQFNQRVVGIDATNQWIHFSYGGPVSYDYLISTMPLDTLLHLAGIRLDLADQFLHTSTHIIGIGLDGQPPSTIQNKHWIYFPESAQPFYRATILSNYSSTCVPHPGKQWALIVEVSETESHPVNRSLIILQVVEALIACKLIERSNIVSRWHCRLEHGYPTPWLGRDAVLEEVDAVLRDAGIYSRGRFGAWKYEVSNQDHSVMQGVEAVDKILNGDPERTYYGNMTDSPRNIPRRII
jgi:protoporphyrinogen oxidase